MSNLHERVKKIIEETRGALLASEIMTLTEECPEHQKKLLLQAFVDDHGFEKIIKDSDFKWLVYEIKTLVEAFPEHQNDLIQAFLDEQEGLKKIIKEADGKGELAYKMKTLAEAFPESREKLFQFFVNEQGLKKIIQDEDGSYWLSQRVKTLAEAFPESREKLLKAFLDGEGLEKIKKAAHGVEQPLAWEMNRLAEVFPKHQPSFQLPFDEIKPAILNTIMKDDIKEKSKAIKSSHNANTFFVTFPRELCKDVVKFTCSPNPEIVTEGDIEQSFATGFDKELSFEQQKNVGLPSC
ncbi:hypothetical protein [Legionella spiritensis]|uniref:Uncharacterized protein n=1 Tax=Legionella spiritensis TaxID=452 RepID=A0A0W0YZ59_LEGSP|nr:hypothetical protein [Legionella spiritensis]KTD62120.1 hypothetical protein Lspi_1970 [Legionella spiritensis]SNV34122.1 Uncharacterised protein [Legionella spiritensis]